MTESSTGIANIDRAELRRRVSEKYRDVAMNPGLGFHFHTGAPLARMLGYPEAALAALPEAVVASFAGTGNPFRFGELAAGEVVLDVGCGAGMDSLIAAGQVGPTGRVVAIDMTAEMRAKALSSAKAMGFEQLAVLDGYAESLPVGDGEVDVVISNGVVNLCPDKVAVFREMFRVLRPGGRIQVGDILVHEPVPQDARDDIELWSG